MTTAREQLYEEVVAMLGRSGDALAADMRKTMARYRVQTKPGVDVAAGTTARDALGERLVGIVQGGQGVEEIKRIVGTTIDEFRMQLKQAGPATGDKPAAPRPRPAASSTPALAKPGASPARAGAPGAAAVRAQAPSALDPPRPRSAGPASPSSSSSAPPARNGLPPQALAVGEAPRMRVPVRPEPAVHGGPRARRKQRGECPKCHSIGVVLARSYSGDDYYSCIYCGWQAFKPTDENDPNVSLAMKLLGQTLGND